MRETNAKSFRKNSSPRVESIPLRPRLEIHTCIFEQNGLSKSLKLKIIRSFWQYPNVDIKDRCDAADIIWKKMQFLL